MGEEFTDVKLLSTGDSITLVPGGDWESVFTRKQRGLVYTISRNEDGDLIFNTDKDYYYVDNEYYKVLKVTDVVEYTLQQDVEKDIVEKIEISANPQACVPEHLVKELIENYLKFKGITPMSDIERKGENYYFTPKITYSIVQEDAKEASDEILLT